MATTDVRIFDKLVDDETKPGGKPQILVPYIEVDSRHPHKNVVEATAHRKLNDADKVTYRQEYQRYLGENEPVVGGAISSEDLQGLNLSPAEVVSEDVTLAPKKTRKPKKS